MIFLVRWIRVMNIFVLLGSINYKLRSKKETYTIQTLDVTNISPSFKVLNHDHPLEGNGFKLNTMICALGVFIVFY